MKAACASRDARDGRARATASRRPKSVARTNVDAPPPPPPPPPPARRASRVLCVTSGKGGTGKSVIATNLADPSIALDWYYGTELGLTLGTGIYGSTFFMLTGFHGFHVTLGAIMLVCIWLRTMNGHFTPERHFAFEAVAWYWHFVDVVWLGLFIFVYWI